jgi:hypothetical protein
MQLGMHCSGQVLSQLAREPLARVSENTCTLWLMADWTVHPKGQMGWPPRLATKVQFHHAGRVEHIYSLGVDCPGRG